MQAALSNLPGIRGVVAAYPMLDLKARHFTKFNVHAGVVDRYLSTMREGEIVSKDFSQARLILTIAILQQGRLVEFLGQGVESYPMERINVLVKRGGGELDLPRLWIYHGRQDMGVVASGSERFVEQARKVWGVGLRFDLVDGEHGLDQGPGIEDAAWLKDGVKWVTEKWLAAD